MALTKKELAARVALEARLLEARALSYPNWTPPKPLVLSRCCENVVEGWVFNEYSKHVEKAWYKTFYYKKDPRIKGSDRYGGSQSGGPLYATELDATLAMLHRLTMKAAEDIALVLKRVDDLRELESRLGEPPDA